MNNNKQNTRFEKARIIGARTLQISMGAPTMIKYVDEIDNDPLKISMDEYDKSIIPIEVKNESLKNKKNIKSDI